MSATKNKRQGQRAKEVTDIKVHIGAHTEPPVILRRRPVVGNAKPQRFVSLHHHSTFSYLDGYQLPEAHVRRVAELNMGAMALNEHGNIDSHTQFERAAKKQGVKAIFGCLPAGYMIETPEGAKPIEEMQVGDEVFTHLGRVRRVVHTMKRQHVGKIYGIQPTRSEDSIVWVTGEHPILVATNPNGENEEQRWIRADEIEGGKWREHLGLQYWKQFAVVPRHGEGDITELHVNGRTIPLNEETARFLGMYVAEGSRAGKQARWSFGPEEMEFAEEVRATASKLFGAEVVIKRRMGGKNGIEVRSIGGQGREMYAWLVEMCGTGAYYKRVPKPIFEATGQAIMGFLGGLVDGDGRYSTSGQIILKMASRNVVYGVRRLLTMNGWFSSVHHHTSKRLRKDGSPSENYTVQWCPDQTVTTRRHVMDDDNIYLPIREVTSKDYDGFVYNFEVEEDHSYLSGISLHNCEVYMPANVAGEGETQRKHHLTLIARNAEGYRNLIKLVTASWKNFYHEPTVTMKMLRAHKRGLIVLSGCQGSLLACSTVGGKGIEVADASYQRGLAVARMFKRILGKWFFIEVQAFPELEKSRNFNVLAGKLARAIGTKLVATMDCHYTLLEEQEVQKILHNLRPGKVKTIEQQAREWGYEVGLCPPPNDRSIYRKLRATGLTKTEAIEAIVTTEELAQECNVELPMLPMVQFPLPDTMEMAWIRKQAAEEGIDEKIAYWRHLLKEGWKFRGFDKLKGATRKEYIDRLKHEMKLIESKDFVNYFLLVQAGVRHIKEDHGIPVGPARGSAAASVAAYLLRITEVDPLRPEFGGLLRFERFIDESREDLPDIDLDFPSRARPLLRKFYEKMFGGSDYVTNVGTFVYFRNKVALDDAARVFHVPKWEVEKVKNYLIERSSADLRASSTVEDTIAQFPAAADVIERYPDLQKAALLEGGIKGFGVHAAALVLSNDPITTVTPLVEREVPKGSGTIVQVVGLDKRDAEYRGLLKMDFLGLNTMSMIEDAIEHPLVEMSIDELYGLPLDDPKVYERFQANDVVGVFQWDGRATRFVNGAVKPSFFRELMDINALSRPGPLHGGGTREYIETKHGRQTGESLHPALDILTKPTHYQIVYQEQILSILRQVGNFPWGVTAEVRKIISKKFGEQAFNAKHKQFMDGVATVHKRMDVPPMNEAVGNTIWRRMITAGSYAFNAAHCASYSLIAYWCMWLKIYHPSVFYWSALKWLPEDKRKELIRDAEKHEVKILPPHLKKSRQTWWTSSRKYVRAGFEEVSGIGPKTAPIIIAERRKQPFKQWNDLTRIKGIGPKSVAKIREFAEKDDPFEVYKLERNIAAVSAEIRAGKLGPLPIPTHSGATLDANQGKEMRVVWLGTITQRNVRDLFEYTYSKTGEELDPATVKDPELREWVVCRGEDDTEPVMLKINRWRYPRFKDAVMGAEMEQDLVLVQGRRPSFAGTRQINVDNLWVIAPEEEDQPRGETTQASKTSSTKGVEQTRTGGSAQRSVRRKTNQVGESVHTPTVGGGLQSTNGSRKPRRSRAKTQTVAT